jgi:hypothetical protein
VSIGYCSSATPESSGERCCSDRLNQQPQSGHAGRRKPRQLSGVKRTSQLDRAAAANDLKQTCAPARDRLQSFDE